MLQCISKKNDLLVQLNLEKGNVLKIENQEIRIGIQTCVVNLVLCSLYNDMLRALWLSTCSDDLEEPVRLWFH